MCDELLLLGFMLPFILLAHVALAMCEGPRDNNHSAPESWAEEYQERMDAEGPDEDEEQDEDELEDAELEGEG